jgi:hypothetical protein
MMLFRSLKIVRKDMYLHKIVYLINLETNVIKKVVDEVNKNFTQNFW